MGTISIKESGSCEKSHIHIQLYVIQFNEGEHIICYSPELDLSSYGMDEKSAKSSFDICLKEFLSYAIEHQTLDSELKRLGWKKRGSKTIPPSLGDMMQHNETLNTIIRQSNFSNISRKEVCL